MIFACLPPRSPLIYIYIYFFYLRFFKNGFHSAHLANRLKNPHRLGDKPKKPKEESGKKWKHKGEFEGLQLDALVGF